MTVERVGKTVYFFGRTGRGNGMPLSYDRTSRKNNTKLALQFTEKEI